MPSLRQVPRDALARDNVCTQEWRHQKAIEKNLKESHAIQLEDKGVCESVQRGMNSASFKYGRYPSLLEKAVHQFHIRLYRDMRGWTD